MKICIICQKGDDDGATPKPYVEYGVMGQSYLGYDMPYLIVARDSAAVQKWLDFSEQAEETGTAVIEELQRSGDDDYQVPVLYSNIHANEVAAADAVMEFARLIIEEPVVEYTKLTGFTEEGKAKSEEQRKELGLYTMHLIGRYDPVTLVEVHGKEDSFQIDPSIPPHQPNFEYDLIMRHQLAGGEAFGAAAIANNPSYQSFLVLMRDLMHIDENGTLFLPRGGDDMPAIYTPTYAMLHGCVGYTVELPAYNEITRQAGTYGLLGLADYAAANKESYFADLAENYSRGIENRNSDAEVGPWFTDTYDNIGAEAEIFRPAHTGEGENGQFFPECYLIPLDAENQTNLQAACDMIEYLTRNDVKVSIADSPVTADGKTLPAGTAVVSMYQAKRSVANAVLYEGTFISTWDFLSNDAVAAFNYILTGTGVKDPDLTARVIGKTPVVYISGTKEALTKDPDGFVYNTLVSYSNDYSNDRTAMEQMGFDTTEDASAADAVAGGADLDEDSLAAVQSGVPYVGYTDYAAESIQECFLPDVQIGYTDGIDCLGYVTYPEETPSSPVS